MRLSGGALCLLLTLCACHVRTQLVWDTYPSNEYEYSLRRDYLQDREAEMEANGYSLTQDEHIVDQYLQYHKYAHFEETRATGFPPLRPIEQMLDTIRGSEVYRLLKPLPKGGNMHTHESHELSRRTLLDIVWNSTDFQYLYILPENSSLPYTLDFFLNPPSSEWVPVQGHSYYTKERILENIHLIGILSDKAKAYPTDSDIRWSEMNLLWDRASSQLISNINIKSRYLEAMYDSMLAEGVQYLETRKRFRYNEAMYELNPDPEYSATNGKNYFDPTGEQDIIITKQATQDFIANNPDFIGHNRITYSTRFSGLDVIESDIDNALKLYANHSDHLKGFDIVGQEDAGHSTIFFLEHFLALYNANTEQSDIPVVPHVAETSYPKDLITSLQDKDPVATAQNAYEAVLLGSTRIGHGTAFIKFPYLLQELKTRNVAVEICPVSNQLLGIQADIRNHPALTYMKMGIPVILNSDDPGSFGVDNLNLDWYEAFMAWGLTLRGLKQLANNSLTYSLMSDTEKVEAFDKWGTSWDSYIATVRAEACAAELENVPMEFHRVLPREGAIDGSTKVHVFGRHFEWAVCKNIRCYFNTTYGPGYFVSTTHIICQSPVGPGVDTQVPIRLSFNDGVSFHQTNLDFTYKFPVMVIEPLKTPARSGDCPGTNGGTYLVPGPKSLIATLLSVVWLVHWRQQE